MTKKTSSCRCLALVLQLLLFMLHWRNSLCHLNLYIAKENLKSDLNLDFDSDIYIVSDGKPASLLSNPDAFKGLIAPLPPTIERIKFRWRSSPLSKEISYSMHVTSSDEQLMQVPTMSVPRKSLVPWYDHDETGFQIDFPCSGMKKGIADLTFYLEYTTVGSGIFNNLKIVVRRQCKKIFSLMKNSTIVVSQRSVGGDNWTRNLIIGLVCSFSILCGLFGGCFVYCYVQKRNRKLQMKFDYDYELKMKQREEELMKRSNPKKEMHIDMSEQESLLNDDTNSSSNPIFIPKRTKDYHRKWKKHRRRRQFRFNENGVPPSVYISHGPLSPNRGLEKIPEEDSDRLFENNEDTIVENLYSENDNLLSETMESIGTNSSGYNTADSSTLKSPDNVVDEVNDEKSMNILHTDFKSNRKLNYLTGHSSSNPGYSSSVETTAYNLNSSKVSAHIIQNPSVLSTPINPVKDERQSYESESIEEIYRYMNTKWRNQFSDSVLLPQHVIIDHHPIGRGAYGRVHRGKAKGLHKDEPFKMTSVAIKIINATSDFDIITSFVSEALLMKNMQHENIMNLLGVVLQPNQPPLIVTPFMKHTDLNQFLRSSRSTPRRHQNLSSRQLINFGLQIASGMKYLAELRFAHRDLNTRNCMVSEKLTIKISDFSLARDISKTYYKMNKKTRLPIKWMAIESLINYIFSEKTDVWSFGIVLWELMTLGKQPYSGLNNQDMEKHLLSGQRLSQPQNCPDEIYNIMVSCWLEHPEPRPCFADLHQKLSDYEGKYQKYGLDYSISSLTQII